jgi:tetratricopeptide (TPR) repeat protein
MWLLPLSFEGARSHLPPGRYRLPAHHSAAERSLLLGWVARLVPGITHRVEVPWGATLPGGLASPEQTLVAVQVPAGVAPELLDARLSALGGAYQFVYGGASVGQPGWQERGLQGPLVGLIRRNLSRPDHPLVGAQIGHLPVTFAARLTTDMVELCALLEGAVAHRLRYAHLGTDPAEYQASVQLVAGRRLALRLLRLDGLALQEGLDLLVRGAEVAPLRGGLALQQVGLARVVAGDVLLCPLAQRLDDPVIRGAFLAAVPVEAWTSEARRRVATRPPASQRPVVDGVWAAVLAGLAPSPVLEAVLAVPPWVERLSAVLARRVVQALRDLAPVEGAQAAVLGAVLRYQATRDLAEAAGRDEAVATARAWVSASSPVGLRLALGALVLAQGWHRVLTGGHRREMDEAVAEVLALRDWLPAEGAVVAGLDTLALYHRSRGAQALPALLPDHRALMARYARLGLPREAALVEARLGRLLVALGDEPGARACFEHALAVFEQLGAVYDHAVTQGDVARLSARAGALDEALALHEERLVVLDRLGARRARAFARGDVARILGRLGRLDEALALHRRVLQDFEVLGDVRGQASVRGAIARILTARGDLDEAITLHRQRLRVADALEDRDAMAVTWLALGLIERRRGEAARTPGGRRGHWVRAYEALGQAWRLNEAIGHARGSADAAAAYASVCSALGVPVGSVSSAGLGLSVEDVSAD